MKAIITMNNAEISLNLSGIVITIDPFQFEEGVHVLTSFLTSIVPDNLEEEMQKDMGKVIQVMDLITRYKSCFHIDNNEELVITITFNQDGIMNISWEKCSMSIEFNEMMKVMHDYHNLGEEPEETPGDVAPDENRTVSFLKMPKLYEACALIEHHLMESGINKTITPNKAKEELFFIHGYRIGLTDPLPAQQLRELCDIYGLEAGIDWVNPNETEDKEIMHISLFTQDEYDLANIFTFNQHPTLRQVCDRLLNTNLLTNEQYVDYKEEVGGNKSFNSLITDEWRKEIYKRHEVIATWE